MPTCFRLHNPEDRDLNSHTDLKLMELHICITIFIRSNIETYIIKNWHLFSNFVLYYNFNFSSIFSVNYKEHFVLSMEIFTITH